MLTLLRKPLQPLLIIFLLTKLEMDGWMMNMRWGSKQPLQPPPDKGLESGSGRRRWEEKMGYKRGEKTSTRKPR